MSPRCPVERLMRSLGLRGVVRGKVKRTTAASDRDPRPLEGSRRGGVCHVGMGALVQHEAFAGANRLCLAFGVLGAGLT